MPCPALLLPRSALRSEDPAAAAAAGAQLVFQESDRQGLFVFKGKQVQRGLPTAATHSLALLLHGAQLQPRSRGAVATRGARVSPLHMPLHMPLPGTNPLMATSPPARPPQYPVSVLNLPSVVESYKTLDDVNLVKTTDIGQVGAEPGGAGRPAVLLGGWVWAAGGQMGAA